MTGQRRTPRQSQQLPLRQGPVAMLLGLLVLLGLLAAGCTEDTAKDAQGSDKSTTSTTAAAQDSSNLVVASTSWIAAIAKAAGAENIKIIAPTDLQHPADYDPRPSDLKAVTDAKYVLLGGFEAFADKLKEAAGSNAEVVTVEAVNTPDVLHAQVRKLGELFGTSQAAEKWIEKFDARTAELKAEIDAARPNPTPTAIAHKFMANWAQFAGLDLVGTFGPEPVSPTQLAEFMTAKPQLILDNAHVPVGSALDDLHAVKVTVINFPPPSLDLIEVFEINTKAILEAFKKL